MSNIALRYVRTPIDHHRFKNFAEEVWSVMNTAKLAEMSLAQIDEPRDTFELQTGKRYVGRVTQAIRKLIKKHMLDGEVVVETDG